MGANLTPDERVWVSSIVDNISPKVKGEARQAEAALQCYREEVERTRPQVIKEPGTPLYNSPHLSDAEKAKYMELNTAAGDTYSALAIAASNSAKELGLDRNSETGPSLSDLAAGEVMGQDNPACAMPKALAQNQKSPARTFSRSPGMPV